MTKAARRVLPAQADNRAPRGGAGAVVDCQLRAHRRHQFAPAQQWIAVDIALKIRNVAQRRIDRVAQITRAPAIGGHVEVALDLMLVEQAHIAQRVVGIRRHEQGALFRIKGFGKGQRLEQIGRAGRFQRNHDRLVRRAAQFQVHSPARTGKPQGQTGMGADRRVLGIEKLIIERHDATFGEWVYRMVQHASPRSKILRR